MNSRMNTFFVEIIFVILFFSISVTVTLGLFSGAYQASVLSGEKNAAAIQAQTVAENWKRSGNWTEFEETIKLSEGSENGYELLYDENWNPTSSPAVYRIKLETREESAEAGNIAYLSVLVSKDSGEALFVLETARYISEGADLYDESKG